MAEALYFGKKLKKCVILLCFSRRYGFLSIFLIKYTDKNALDTEIHNIIHRIVTNCMAYATMLIR